MESAFNKNETPNDSSEPDDGGEESKNDNQIPTKV